MGTASLLTAMVALVGCKSEKAAERERQEAERRRCNRLAQCKFGAQEVATGGTRPLGVPVALAPEFPVECPEGGLDGATVVFETPDRFSNVITQIRGDQLVVRAAPGTSTEPVGVTVKASLEPVPPIPNCRLARSSTSLFFRLFAFSSG